jgi:hypothetical protein
MERKVTWRTKGFKQYKNGSMGKNPGQAKKNPPGGMDVCVVFVIRTVIWNVKWHEGRKDLNSTKMDQWGKTPDRQKKKPTGGHGCLCCVCYKDGNMERKVTWRTEGFKQYKNGSMVKNPGQTKKKPTGGHGCLSVVSVVCCQVEVSATGWSLVQRSPTECGVSQMCVIVKPGQWRGPGPYRAVEP